ncbi:MAG TPA: HAMP domain-containing sensor histidine kinase [Gaiellaceae bacterium]|nr:HAMP domain-containing sensor histidine kinase [Gaiellaceae bacterium]
MSFRSRLALVSAAAVGVAVVAASIVVFIVVHNELLAQVDRALETRARQLANLPPGSIHVEGGQLDIPGAPFGIESDLVQAVPAVGSPVTQGGDPRFAIPVDERDRDAARGGSHFYYSEKKYRDVEFRVLTVPAAPYALQVARPLTEVNRTVHRITIFLIIIAAGGMGVAAALGLLVSRAALRPVRRLTETAEHVAETRDLSERIETPGTDELGRLARSFNTMLGALQDSSRAQRQLVADASHELRTPLTSLRTNIEVLARGNKLSDEERERLLNDVVEQIGEMTALIGELIEVAREDRTDVVEEPGDVRLDLLAADAIERTRRNRPNVEFVTDLQESFVHGAPSTIERAVANLLDNAAKWSPPGEPVEVAVRGGEVVVRDHGPGIPAEDLPFVFDRFYRARSARGMPGSGLGLAIVKQVADLHDGSVAVEQPEGGGTLMRLRLNGDSMF